MDPTQMSVITVTILTALSPYLFKAGEAVAQEAGKAVFAQAKALYATLKKKFEQTDDVQAQIALETLGESSEGDKQQLVEHITHQAHEDTLFAQKLSTQIDDLNTLLFECLQKRFLVRDLKQVYFRLGIGWDDLVGEIAGRDQKAIALIEHIQARERVPDLINAMWAVYPDLQC